MENENQSKSIRAVVVPVTPFQQNCSIVWCVETSLGAVFDPGGDLDNILKMVEENNITIEKILITHAHLDHAGGANQLSKKLNVPIEGPHEEDLFLMESLSEQGEKFGLRDAQSFKTTRYLKNGDEVTIGNQKLGVRHCPGHTPGHIIFFHEEAQLAVVGDVLFQGSIGRSDLPKGNHEQLINSIVNELWPLGDNMTFIPGHGPLSTFGQERLSNPYVSDFALGIDREITEKVKNQEESEN
ncbi:MAG: MBL fold metallo-hydrolase [Pseudomonadota bacterium]|nr:MBL fold metallo-hydrolase [Pseudomonadota bacterium]